MARHRQHPHADCRHGIDHTHLHARHQQIKQWAASRWMLGEKPGISHWERVERNGLLLATPECDITVIRLFAYLHDSCREDDSYDEEHGPRTAKMIEGLRETLLKDLTDEQFRMLQEASISS